MIITRVPLCSRILLTALAFTVFAPIVASSSVGAMQGGVQQVSGNYSFAEIFYDGKFSCSATVVSSQWLLTAAHCFESPYTDTSDISVQLWQGKVGDSTGWTTSVNEKVLDPSFTVGGHHDLALVHTSSTMPSWVVAIPLMNSSTSLSSGVGVTDFAWGRANESVLNSLPSSVLKSPNGNLVIDACPSNHLILGSLCISERGTTRLVQGDSGSSVLEWVAGAWQIVSVFNLYETNSGQVQPWAWTWPINSSTNSDRTWIQRTIGALSVSNGSIVRNPASGASWLVMADGYRHSIPTGGDYLCFVNQGASVYNYPLLDIETIPDAAGSTATCSSASPPPPTSSDYAETTGSVAHTWTDYADAGGDEGPAIASNETVQVTCRAQGFAVADGDTWWYQIVSSPWSNGYWVSADAFYNDGATSGSLSGTPFFDPIVPVC
jgi:hypothetical protein